MFQQASTSNASSNNEANVSTALTSYGINTSTDILGETKLVYNRRPQALFEKNIIEKPPNFDSSIHPAFDVFI